MDAWATYGPIKLALGPVKISREDHARPTDRGTARRRRLTQQRRAQRERRKRAKIRKKFNDITRAMDGFELCAFHMFDHLRRQWEIAMMEFERHAAKTGGWMDFGLEPPVKKALRDLVSL